MSESHPQQPVSRKQRLFIPLIFVAGLTVLAAMAMRGGPGEDIKETFVPETQADSPVLAQIYGEPISQAEVTFARQYLENAGTTDPVTDEKALNWLIEQRLLARLAEDMKIDQEPNFKRSIKFHRDNILANLANSRLLESAVSEQDIQEFYDNEKGQLRGRIQIKARQIVLPDEAMAVEIMRRLDSGEAFASLALAYSTDRASREFGGDLGYLNRDMPAPNISDAIFSAKDGARIGPLLSADGWHVIDILERRPTPIQSLEQRREDIVDLLRSKAIFTKLEDMRREADITFAQSTDK